MSDRSFTTEEVQVLLAANSKSTLENASIDANSGMSEGIRSRIASLVSGGYDFADTLHNIYLDFGYPAHVEFFHNWNMYRRFGIAKNVVEIYPDLGWMGSPTVETDNKSLSIGVDVLANKMSLWTRVKGLDTRQRVGRYAGLFMRVRDNKQPSEPISGTLAGMGSLVDMIPLYESQLDVITTETDPMEDDYGKPTMYEFRGSSLGNRNPDAVSTFNIHPSRIVIASEDSDNGGIYGVSCLESVYNSLMDLRKIIGAGGEGFYKNAAQSIVFDIKDASSARKNADLLDQFNEQYDEFAKNRSRRAIWTPGMDANTLESHLINPKEFFTNALNDVSAGSKIPATIIIGQQTGRLASDQDSRSLLSSVQARRENFQTIMVKSIIDWFMDYGILPTADYDVEWPDALALSNNERLDNAGKMGEINQSMYSSGQDVPFSGEEVRDEAGWDPDTMEENEPDETLGEDDGEDEDGIEDENAEE